MQKRDKSGRFLKQSVKKKAAKKVKKPKVEVKKAKTGKGYIDIESLSFWDIKDMISAEVTLQMKGW